MEFTEKEKRLLMCAFEIDAKGLKCNNCPNKDNCSAPDEGNGFNLMGQELLRRLGIIK
jgi:hypothetical protein